MTRIVVALGGNAILTDDPSAKGQLKVLKSTARQLIKIITENSNNELVITHGNGPQVGNLLLQQEADASENNPRMPLDTCVAMTQGSIGYWLQNSLTEELTLNKLRKQAVSLVTQVVVDSNDQAFENPSKPIGPFYTEEMAQKLADGTEDHYVEDAGRGYRKVVPSPKPIDIVEVQAIEILLNNDVIPVVAGGGGVPVVKSDEEYLGIEAVIDKDFASAKLAEIIKADLLIILTGVDNVYINFNEPNQEKLEEVSVGQLEDWIEEGQFAPGSMLPKIEAAISFVQKNPNGKAVITSLENLKNYLNGGSATIVES